MKRFGLFIAILTGTLLSNAFHIVGGEIEFIYISDGVYRINLIQYFDEAQEQNPGPDSQVTVYIFRNGDNILMSRLTLPLVSIENVEYTNVECSISELQTSRVLYSAEVNLQPNVYNSPEGYYIQWERCCRNSAVDNVVNPAGTGMNYVVEIPPLMQNGQIFKNSTPSLFKPLSDYACINQLYYVEFTGIDLDGDSLVYSLTRPLNSSSQVALPVPQPKPHFGVNFIAPFSVDNMVGGSRPLQISNRGLLTVTPDRTGLFSFAVKVEEFRDGVKIGEVNRDFQLLVIDDCEPPDPPVVDIEIPGNPTFNPLQDVLTYQASDVEKCFNFLVANVTQGETISLRAEGVNFDEDVNEIFSLNTIPVGINVRELSVEVCIPDCPPIDGPFILDIIAADNACPLPQLDTLRLTIEVEPPPNEKPVGSTPINTVTRPEDSGFYSQIFTGTDADNDNLDLQLYIEGLENPASFGFTLENVIGTAGSISGTLLWNTDCKQADFSEFQSFRVGVIVNDLDECDVPGDTVYLNTSIILPPNTNPVVSSDISLPEEVELGTKLEFNVISEDQDGDDVSLKFVPIGYNPEIFDIRFDSVQGNTSVSGPFSWDLACNSAIYQDGQEFELLFVADDDDKCKTKNFDTLRHIVRVRYPQNTAPVFNETSQYRQVYVNEELEIELSAIDADASNQIEINFAEGFRIPASESLSLESSIGSGSTSAILRWQPECSLLRPGESSSLQDVVLEVRDNACPDPTIDTLKITFEILDNDDRQSAFLPPNVFTPNGDGKNDVFRLSKNPDVSQNLPPDNCNNFFEGVIITNRAGTPVFESGSRDFVWDGGGFPAGIYFYVIRYSSREVKGYIHLMR